MTKRCGNCKHFVQTDNMCMHGFCCYGVADFEKYISVSKKPCEHYEEKVIAKQEVKHD